MGISFNADKKFSLKRVNSCLSLTSCSSHATLAYPESKTQSALLRSHPETNFSMVNGGKLEI
jgi:hypothetical protein